MDQVLAFFGNHSILWIGFFIIILLLIVNEIHSRMVGARRLTAQGLTDLLNHGEAVVIDLRTSEQFQQGHIIDAMNIPQESFKERMSELHVNKDKAVVLVCAQGHYSVNVSNLLRKQGFRDLGYLVGGMRQWDSENYPVVKGQ